MIRHVVLIKFKPESATDDRMQGLARLQALPEQINLLRIWNVGMDQMHLPRSYDLAIVADFTSLDEVRAYRAHPAHVEMAAFMDPLIEHIHSVDFEMQTPLA